MLFGLPLLRGPSCPGCWWRSWPAAFWTSAMNYRMGLGFKLSPSRNAFLLAADCLPMAWREIFFVKIGPKEHFYFLPVSLPSASNGGGVSFSSTRCSANLKPTKMRWDSIVRGTIAAYPREISGQQRPAGIPSTWAPCVRGTKFPHLWRARVERQRDAVGVPPRDLLDISTRQANPWPSAQAGGCHCPRSHRRIPGSACRAACCLPGPAVSPGINYFLASAIVFLGDQRSGAWRAGRCIPDRYQSRVAWLMRHFAFSFIFLAWPWSGGAATKAQLPWLMQIDLGPSPSPVRDETS